MALALAFGAVLLLSVSLSGLAARTVLSTALLFLLAGALLGPGVFGVVDLSLDTVSRLADIALFTVLFTDGQRVSVQALREGWRLSGRALLLGMPLIMVGVAVPVHFLAGLDWPTAFLIGAILAPTDPVFASIIVGREDIPLRLRRLLNVESGLNDGLALPFVLLLIAAAAHESAHPLQVAGELALGLLFGVAIPLAISYAWRLRVFSAEPRLQPLGPLAIAVLLYAACHLTHANPYLAAFVAGSTLATLDRTAVRRFHPFGDLLSELAKFGALLVFGALITPDRITDLSWGAWAVAGLAIFLVRPTAILLSMLRTRLSPRERAAAAWFGPKGFASVVYGLHALQSPIPHAEQVFDLVAITIALSIVLHSSTDVPFAKLLRVRPPDNLPGGREETEEETGEQAGGETGETGLGARRLG
ncbi:sodium/proton antiporter (CPA1 family) [Prauserella shujinwangii]|uniref:Sodium/proton antiporter (CPA1 family) n=1 Tax=Prauserella shujinwangii TaxID=1453103 RepID=A0A2T0LL60_9PSEU|nr:cation:proton antiporter [Prauserella shujinwangii]PRX43689.1 sodium/proton antiporter (CPA1 family) [Prauserella shujinwangii]